MEESRNILMALVLRWNAADSSWVPIASLSPKTTDEANRCILGHLTPKTLQKALPVGYFKTGQPLQVVGFGWSQFPFPEPPLAGQAAPIYCDPLSNPSQGRQRLLGLEHLRPRRIQMHVITHRQPACQPAFRQQTLWGHFTVESWLLRTAVDPPNNP